MQKCVEVNAYEGGRQQGVTTLLLDAALANAARGAFVVFWAQAPLPMRCAFQEARNLADGDPRVSVARQANGCEQIEYMGGGRVRFVWGEYDPYRFGRADMHVVDTAAECYVMREPDWTMRAADARRSLR